jgi:hypothetical protein
MYHTTGLERERITDLCVWIHEVTDPEALKWPPILGLFRSVLISLTYLRRNRVQQELAETYGVSQPTISRAITVVTPLLGAVLRRFVPTAEELNSKSHYIVDGTLLPCWSWADHPQLYSGKHKTTGMNVQVVCTLDGDIEGYSASIRLIRTAWQVGQRTEFRENGVLDARSPESRSVACIILPDSAKTRSLSCVVCFMRPA